MSFRQTFKQPHPTFARMFNRYWRTYPWFFQLFQLIILIFILLSFFGGVVTPLAVKQLTGYNLTDITNLSENSTAGLRRAALLAQGIFSIGLFVLPPLLFAYATHPRPAQYLGLRKPKKVIHAMLAILLILAMLPVEVKLAEWISLLPWGESTKLAEERSAKVAQTMITATSVNEYLLAMLVASILPGLGEELFFRGIFMRFAAKRFSNIGIPLLISATMFAFAHGSIFNFVPILLAGLTLGLIYYLTGSLWMNMLAHAVYNGLQITLIFLMKDNAAIRNMMETNQIPLWLFAVGLVLSAGLLYLFFKVATPLPPSWSEDYDPGEPRETESTHSTN